LGEWPRPEDLVRTWYKAAIRTWLLDETARLFECFSKVPTETVAVTAEQHHLEFLESALLSIEASSLCEQKISKLFGFSEAALDAVRGSCGFHPCEYSDGACDGNLVSEFYRL